MSDKQRAAIARRARFASLRKPSGLFRLRLGAAISFPFLLAGLLVDRGLHPAAVVARGAVAFRRHCLAGCRLWLSGFLFFLGGYPAISERRKDDGGGPNCQGPIQHVTHGASPRIVGLETNRMTCLMSVG